MDSNKYLQVRVLYCRDIKAFNFFQKLAVYVVASIESENPDKKKLKEEQSQKTRADKQGDGNPEWEDETMRFDLEEAPSLAQLDHVFLKFEVRHQGGFFGDKTIGQARVPLKDLIQESSDGTLRFVSYQVRGLDGSPNGLVHFSYKLVNCHGNHPEAESSSTANNKIGGYPAVESSPAPHKADQSGVDDPIPKVEYPNLDPPPPPPPYPNHPPHHYYPPPFPMFPQHPPPPPPPPMFHPPRPSPYTGNWGAPHH